MGTGAPSQEGQAVQLHRMCQRFSSLVGKPLCFLTLSILGLASQVAQCEAVQAPVVPRKAEERDSRVDERTQAVHQCFGSVSRDRFTGGHEVDRHTHM